MNDFKEVPILGTDKHTLINALNASGYKAVELTAPLHKIEDGPVITAMTKKYGSDVHTVLALVNFITRPFSNHIGACKFWILATDHDARIVRFAVTSDTGVDITLLATRIATVSQRLTESGHGSKVETAPAQCMQAPVYQAPTKEFVNESDNEFTDISSEATRTYNFGSKGFVKINNPMKLSVSPSGGHRIFSADGHSHYIPSGWVQLSWTVKPGQPNFVK